MEIAKHLIRTGADIVTDTNMALSGVNKKELEAHGGMARCFMVGRGGCRRGKERKVTRAVVSMEHAAKLDKPVIFAIGNAPTALIRLYELICDGIYRPAFIIGVPVGFVNVEVAKEMILHTDVPCIVNRGRKGGSNVLLRSVMHFCMKCGGRMQRKRWIDIYKWKWRYLCVTDLRPEAVRQRRQKRRHIC